MSILLKITYTKLKITYIDLLSNNSFLHIKLCLFHEYILYYLIYQEQIKKM